MDIWENEAREFKDDVLSKIDEVKLNCQNIDLIVIANYEWLCKLSFYFNTKILIKNWNGHIGEVFGVTITENRYLTKLLNVDDYIIVDKQFYENYLNAINLLKIAKDFKEGVLDFEKLRLNQANRIIMSVKIPE